jgi:hypothetical protein
MVHVGDAPGATTLTRPVAAFSGIGREVLPGRSRARAAAHVRRTVTALLRPKPACRRRSRSDSAGRERGVVVVLVEAGRERVS